ncbi:MAG: diguanylate cyclase [Candidatus Gracilibacteria bacterium]|nr:diguanylate cyclase [Candidatus Gracilibacteria bacterium]MDD2908685.1 diguanylate cyclase [Candidatus Gracilibacteria bacterium]
MSIIKPKSKKIKPEFYATKLYLSKLSEKYKSRGYEKIFLENDFNFLSDVKNIIKNINIQNNTLDEILNGITESVQKISKLGNIDPKVKKILVENNILLFAKFMDFVESIIKNEDMIMESVDRFRKIEKKIDTKSKALTKYGFNKELSYVFESLKNKKHKELTMVIFDMNNLKTLNESYGHQTGSESIIKFGSIIKEELNLLGIRYLLSNYFGGDEWFLCLIDSNQKESISLVNKIFQTLNNNTYMINDFDIKLSACAGIAHYHPIKSTQEYIEQKTLIHVADTLVLQSKVRKTRNKSGNAYKVLNISQITPEEALKISKNIQTMPKSLLRKTLNKKKLVELFNIRKTQNENIMRARTLGVKNILRTNIDLINEIIGNKIIESISQVLTENKNKTFEKIETLNEKLVNIVINEIDKMTKKVILSVDEKEYLINKILKSDEFQKYTKIEIDSIYESNIFQLNNKI